MRIIKYTLDLYKKKFYEKYPDSTLIILELIPECHVKVENEYGVCIVQRNNLLQQGKVSIQSAIDKTSYYINEVKKIHGDKYNYSQVVYNNSFSRIKIICKVHDHLFNQLSNAHLQGQGCKLCANDLRKNDDVLFIEKCKKVHGDKYNYDLVDYVNSTTKIKVVCFLHGEFLQQAMAHSKGQGCPKCGDENVSLINKNNSTGWKYSNWEKQSLISKNFESYKVYIIKCWNENEEFYKIGKTFSNIENRFKTKRKMPYNYEIIELFSGTAKEMSEKEKFLQKINKENKYLPNIKFNGLNECFKKIRTV